MNTIEQAQEVADGLRHGFPSTLRVEAADTIDSLIAELASIKQQQPCGWTYRKYNGDIDVVSEHFTSDKNEAFDNDKFSEPVYLAAGAQPVQQEPVKFVWQQLIDFDNGKSWAEVIRDYDPRLPQYRELHPDMTDSNTRNFQALYAAPVQAQERKPLTVAEVEQILSRWNYDLHGDRARYIVRETELAHGIKERNQ